MALVSLSCPGGRRPPLLLQLWLRSGARGVDLRYVVEAPHHVLTQPDGTRPLALLVGMP